MKRRTFVGFLLTASTTGCLHGGEAKEGNETASEPPEQTEFGLMGWVPRNTYSTLTYLDYTRIREFTSVGDDTEGAGIVEGVEVEYSNIDELISATTGSGNGFEAYKGNFDSEALAGSVADSLGDAERTEFKGYTFVRRSDGSGSVLALSDESVIVGTAEMPSEVVNVSVGDATPHAESDSFLADAPTFAEDPFGLTVDYRRGAYKILDETDDGLAFVEVIEHRSEDRAQKTYENYSIGDNEDFAQIEREGTKVSISSKITPDGVDGLLELFPRWSGEAQENKI